MCWSRRKSEGFLYSCDRQRRRRCQCLILKEKSKSEGEDALYEIVEDEVELQAVSKVFEELLEDVGIEL